MGLVKYKTNTGWESLGLQYPILDEVEKDSKAVVTSKGIYEEIHKHADDKTNNPHGITAAMLGLSGGVNFIGVSTSPITEYGTETPTIEGYTGEAKSNGNVVLWEKTQFIWSQIYWKKFKENETTQSLITTTGTLVGQGEGNLRQAIPDDIPGFEYTTIAPTAPYIGTGLKVAVLDVDPEVHYDGWLYLIKSQ